MLPHVLEFKRKANFEISIKSSCLAIFKAAICPINLTESFYQFEMMTSKEDQTLMAGVYDYLYKQCSQVAKDNLNSTDQQFQVLLNMKIPDLNGWYLDNFVPAMDQYQGSVTKSHEKAMKHLELAEWYNETDDEHFVDKAFENVNMVSFIIFVFDSDHLRFAGHSIGAN